MSQLSEKEHALVEVLGKESKTPVELRAKLKELFARTLETKLEAELDEHLGYVYRETKARTTGMTTGIRR